MLNFGILGLKPPRSPQEPGSYCCHRPHRYSPAGGCEDGPGAGSAPRCDPAPGPAHSPGRRTPGWRGPGGAWLSPRSPNTAGCYPLWAAHYLLASLGRLPGQYPQESCPARIDDRPIQACLAPPTAGRQLLDGQVLHADPVVGAHQAAGCLVMEVGPLGDGLGLDAGPATPSLSSVGRARLFAGQASLAAGKCLCSTPRWPRVGYIGVGVAGRGEGGQAKVKPGRPARQRRRCCGNVDPDHEAGTPAPGRVAVDGHTAWRRRQRLTPRHPQPDAARTGRHLESVTRTPSAAAGHREGLLGPAGGGMADLAGLEAWPSGWVGLVVERRYRTVQVPEHLLLRYRGLLGQPLEPRSPIGQLPAGVGVGEGDSLLLPHVLPAAERLVPDKPAGVEYRLQQRRLAVVDAQPIAVTDLDHRAHGRSIPGRYDGHTVPVHSLAQPPSSYDQGRRCQRRLVTGSALTCGTARNGCNAGSCSAARLSVAPMARQDSSVASGR